MADSTQTDNPTNADAPNTGDVKTVVLDNLTGESQSSGGEPDSTPQPAPSADVTGQPKDDVTPPDDDGKLSRLEQMLAQNNQLLTALGIDSESDIAERFQKGLVSKEELLLRAGVQVPAKTEPTATEPVSAVDRFNQLQQRLKQSVSENKGITETDILAVMDATSGLAKESAKAQENVDMERRFNDCRSATLAVIDKDAMHVDLPDNIKEIESQVFLSSTDNLLATETKGDPRYLTAQNYSFYADKNLERLNTLRNHWIEYGRNAKPAPPVPNQVNPISPTVGSAPITPPETPTTLENMNERAKAYIQLHGVV